MTRVGSLRDVVEKSTGTRNPAVQPDDEFTYVDVSAIDNQQKIINGDRSLLGSEAPSRARKLLRANDVLVSTVRPNLNAVALVPSELNGQVGSTGFCVLRAVPSRALPEYLFYFVRSQRFVDALAGLVAGALYPAVTDSQVLDQELPLPSLSEQRRIVDLLSRAEGIVRLRRQAQQKAAALIPAIFVDMFGDPATNPKGWPELSMGTVVTEYRYGTSQKSGEDGYPTLRIPNVIGNSLDPADMKLVDVRKAEADRIRLVDGDLLFVRTNGNPDYVGRSAVFEKGVLERAGFDGENCLYASYLIRARLDQQTVAPTFLQAFLSSTEGRKRIRAEARTSAGQYNINTQGLASVVVPLPPRDLQASFVRRCRQFMGLAELQATATQKAEESFQALLGRAFSATDHVPLGNAHEEALA